MRILLLFGIGLCNFHLAAQNEKLAEITAQLEKYMEYRETEIDFSDLSAGIENLLKHPLDINKSDAAELQVLFFLSDIQVQNLIKHRAEFGDLLSLLELQIIPSWDQEIARLASYFLSVAGGDEACTLKNSLRKSDGEISTLLSCSFPRGPEYFEPEVYKGSFVRSLTKLKYFYSNRFSSGLSAEKDAGETFTFRSQPGYDFLSAHFYYCPRKLVQAFVIGDYQLSFGQGLSLASGISLGKSADIKSLSRNVNGFRPYRSVNENNFLRGLAIQLGKGRIKSNFCSSSLRIDGHEKTGAAISINESGYHRSEKELEERKKLRRSLLALNSSYHGPVLLLGTNLCLSKLGKADDLSFENIKLNVGLYYRYVIHNFSFSGEVASGSDGGFATVQSILGSLGQRFDLCLFYRNYSYAYSAAFANPISGSGSYNAEKGLYAGFNMKLRRSLQLNAYYDIYRLPALTYLADAPSRGRDYLVEISYQPKRQLQLLLRIKSDGSEKNSFANTESYDRLHWQERKSLRLQLIYKVGPFLEYRCRYEQMNFISDRSLEKGHLLFHDLVYRPLERKYKLILRLAAFSSGSWYTRIYSYENEMPNAYTITAYSNRGIRSYILVNYDFSRKLQAWLRLSRTSYFNQAASYSEEDESRTEIKLQLAFRF